MAYSLWKDEWKTVNLKTLNTLCNLFKCTPNDLLEFKPDPDEYF
jgi:Predicted transcriptional regulator